MEISLCATQNSYQFFYDLDVHVRHSIFHLVQRFLFWCINKQCTYLLQMRCSFSILSLSVGIFSLYWVNALSFLSSSITISHRTPFRCALYKSIRVKLVCHFKNRIEIIFIYWLNQLNVTSNGFSILYISSKNCKILV